MISVLIPTFNSEIYIYTTLKSVSNQSLQPDEIIIYDDASKDKTLDIIRQNFAQNTNVKIIEGIENIGILRARQKLIESASGDIVFFLDHDDEWKSDYIEKVVDVFLHTDHGMVVVAAERINHLGNVVNAVPKPRDDVTLNTGLGLQKSVEYVFLWYPIPTWSCVSFRKEFGFYLKEISNLQSGEEFCFASLILQTQSILLINRYFVRYRVHMGNASRNAMRQFDTEVSILAWFLQKFPFLKMSLMQKTIFIYANALYRAIVLEDRMLFIKLFAKTLTIFGNKKLYFLFFSPVFLIAFKLLRIFR
jgi:glycosyltransferase involved in cell wall biosynthesis